MCFSFFRYGPPTRTEYRLTVENLSSRVSWQVSNICTLASHFYYTSDSFFVSLIATRGFQNDDDMRIFHPKCARGPNIYIFLLAKSFRISYIPRVEPNLHAVAFLALIFLFDFSFAIFKFVYGYLKLKSEFAKKKKKKKMYILIK